jgi:outer membrane protein OmpA-like peptidoglycan-associated protein
MRKIKESIGFCLLFVTIYFNVYGEDINWAPKLIFNYDESNLASFRSSDLDTDQTEKNEWNSDLSQYIQENSALVIAEYTEPINISHLYIVTFQYEPEINNILLINQSGQILEVAEEMEIIQVKSGNMVFGFRNKFVKKNYQNIKKILLNLSSVSRHNSPNISAVGSAENQDRINDFSKLYFESALTSVREIKVYDEKEIQKIEGIPTFYNKKEKLSQLINTPFEEVKPLISTDGNYLFFARKGYPGNVKGKKDQDIFVSQYYNGHWSSPKSVGKSLNDKYPNGVCSISPDGSALLLLNRYNSRGRAYDGISVSTKEKNGWSKPVGMEIEGYINICQFHDFSLNKEGNVLLMAIEHDITFGGQDIYVSFKLNETSWTKPENIGPVINTPYEEYAPFIAADDKTVYFASNGHEGYGAGDILMTRREDETWKNWTEPVNVGPEVNTSDWDGYFTVPAKGDYAYFTSTGSRLNERIYDTEDEDIYRIPLREEVRPEPVVVLSGRVYDRKTQKPLGADVLYENYVNKSETGSIKTSVENNYYSFVFNVGNKYHLNAEANDYLRESFDLDYTNISAYTEIEKDIYLNPIEKGEILKLNNLFFVQSKAELLPESLPELERLYKMLIEMPSLEIELGGHTDNQGVATANMRLSRERAEAVKRYLIEKGIERDRITAVGYGEKKPIVANKDPEVRKQNRRVEVKILKK